MTNSITTANRGRRRRAAWCVGVALFAALAENGLAPEEVAASSSLDWGRTIDRITMKQYAGHASVDEPLHLMASAESYTFADGSVLPSSPFDLNHYRTTLHHVEQSGSTIRFFLDQPANGFLFSQLDIADEYRSSGTLAVSGALVIEAQAGGTQGVLRGLALIVANEPNPFWKPFLREARFSYYTSVPGSVVPFEITYTLAGSTWSANSWSQGFDYSTQAWVDFTQPVSGPQMIGLRIEGPRRVPEEFEARYAAIARFEGGVERVVTKNSWWTVEPSQVAQLVSPGVVRTGVLPSAESDVTIRVRRAFASAEVSATYDVRARRDDPVELPGSWPLYQANSRHTGEATLELDAPQLRLFWTRSVEFGVGPLTVAEGRVAFVNNESEVQVVRAADGEVLWSRNLGHLVTANPPALAYGNVYVQVVNHVEDTWLWALDAASGARVFRSPFDSQWQSYLAPTLFDGKVYVDGGYGDGMFAFDAYTGDRLWFTQLPQFDGWTPAIDDHHAYAYMGGGVQAGLYRLDRSSGSQDLFIADPDFEDPSGGMWQAPVLGGRNNVVSTNGHRLLSFDLASGTLSAATLGQAWYQASIHDGMIYVVDTGRLRVFDEETLSEVWSWEEPGPWLQSPLIVAGRYVFATKGDETLAIDRTTHQVAWRYPARGSLAVAEGRLFIGASGRLLAFAPRPAAPTSFYTLPPCRLMDTRLGSGAPVGGPTLAAGNPRSVSTVGRCGIPLSAKALAVNVTATNPTAHGFVQIDAAMGSPGAFSTLAIRPGLTRAAHATVSILDGQLFATLDAPAGATTDLVIDVSGYFE